MNKKLYVSLTDKHITKPDLWKQMADFFRTHWKDGSSFLVRSERKLAETGRIPDRSKIVLELDLEESLENPDQTVLVLRDAKRDYVLETEKDMPAEILALLGVALIAAGMYQLEAFALKENGFCMNEDLIVDLSETGFLQLFLGKDRKEKQRLKADLLKSRTREIEDGLLPLYEKEKARVLKKDSTVTQENAGKISEALFNRKGIKEILQTLAELEREIEEVSRKTAYNDFLNGGRLHSWNVLFADYMRQVMNGNEEAEKKLCLLFDPKLDVLADEVQKEMHQIQPEDTDVAAMKTKLQFLRFIRMDSTINAPIQQAFAEDTINSMDGSFLDEHELTEQKRIFFLLLQELISQTLENGYTPLQEHNIHSFVLVMLSSLPEERDEAIWQIMTALACASVLYPQGPYGIQLAPELMLEGPAKSMSWFLVVCEDDPQFIVNHTELAALSLCAILQYVSLSPDLVERAISAADGLFLAMSASARLKKPLDPVTLLALERLIRQMLTVLDRQENELKDELSAESNEEEEEEDHKTFARRVSQLDKQKKAVCRPVLNWIEKYASLHGLASLNNVYEDLWFLVHEQSASDNQKQKFADLCRQWGLAHPEKSRYFMTRVYQHLYALPGHQYSLMEGPDLLFQSALHQYLDACVFDMEKLYEKPQRLTETVGWFCGNDMFALPALVFEKMISLFDENKEPDQMEIEFSDPQEEELEEWEQDHSWEEGLADDLHSRFLRIYCEQRLKASVDALNCVFLLHFQKDNVEPGTMLVQAGRLLEWFRDRKNLEKLEAMDQARAVDLCYEMSRELSRAGLYGHEDEYLRFAQSVLLEMDEKDSLNEPLKEALQDTEYRLLQKARLESDPDMAREQAALLKDLIEREEREYRTSYQDLLYYEAVRELSRSLEGQKKYLMCADAMSVLEKDDRISDDGAHTCAPQIHDSILDGWRDLIESALEEGEFQIAANMTLHLMEKTLPNSDSPREAAFRRFGLSSLVRAFAGSKDKKMAAETAQKMVAVVPDAEYGSSFYTDISYYESAAYLLSLRKPPKEMDIQGFMSRFLQKVPVFSLMEETICDISNTPYVSLLYPEKSWKEMEKEFFSRELTKKEQDVPQPFWQKDLMITLGAVDRVTDISGFYEFNGCKKKCKEGIQAIENLEKTRGVSLEDTKARLAMMEKMPDLIRTFPDPAVFEQMDAAEDALKQAEFENPQVQGLLLHHLNCLRAMAAYMQHDLQKLSFAASKAMQVTADPELSQYIVVMTSSLMVLLMEAGRMLEDNRTKEAETLINQAENLYHRLSAYYARSEIMILDAYLELIRVEITSSRLRALKMRSALQKVTSMQESLRKAAISGQRKLRLDEKPAKLSLKRS